MTSYIYCETAQSKFGQHGTESIFSNGDVSVTFLVNAPIITGNPAYQREKVAGLEFKQGIMRTVLSRKFAGITEIHIRVIKTAGSYRYELMDGQQRVTSILDYLNGEYALPKELVVDGVDLSGLFVNELRDTYPNIFHRLMEYRISCKWYENISNELCSIVFVEILNNTTKMVEQEIRNAIIGVFSDWVRDRSRFDAHELFTRVITKSGKNTKEGLKYFSEKFALKGRMEVDEWLSELVYMKEHGVRQGVSQQNLTKWVRETQAPGGKYAARLVDKKQYEDLLNFAFNIIRATPRQFKVKLNPMTSIILVLYADELRARFGGVVPEKYVAKFFEVYTRWDDIKLGLFKDRLEHNGTKAMPQFSKLFGGKNSNAINTILGVLDEELKKDPSSFGVIEVDQRETFTRSDIIRKWQEQGGKCFYTGAELEEDDLAGDHYIPRSYGISAGGVTEYSNLVVTSKALNIKKGARHGDEFLNELRKAA